MTFNPGSISPPQAPGSGQRAQSELQGLQSKPVPQGELQNPSGFRKESLNKQAPRLVQDAGGSERRGPPAPNVGARRQPVLKLLTPTARTPYRSVEDNCDNTPNELEYPPHHTRPRNPEIDQGHQTHHQSHGRDRGRTNYQEPHQSSYSNHEPFLEDKGRRVEQRRGRSSSQNSIGSSSSRSSSHSRERNRHAVRTPTGEHRSRVQPSTAQVQPSSLPRAPSVAERPPPLADANNAASQSARAAPRATSRIERWAQDVVAIAESKAAANTSSHNHGRQIQVDILLREASKKHRASSGNVSVSAGHPESHRSRSPDGSYFHPVKHTHHQHQQAPAAPAQTGSRKATRGSSVPPARGRANLNDLTKENLVAHSGNRDRPSTSAKSVAPSVHRHTRDRGPECPIRHDHPESEYSIDPSPCSCESCRAQRTSGVQNRMADTGSHSGRNNSHGPRHAPAQRQTAPQAEPRMKRQIRRIGSSIDNSHRPSSRGREEHESSRHRTDHADRRGSESPVDEDYANCGGRCGPACGNAARNAASLQQLARSGSGKGDSDLLRTLKTGVGATIADVQVLQLSSKNANASKPASLLF